VKSNLYIVSENTERVTTDVKTLTLFPTPGAVVKMILLVVSLWKNQFHELVEFHPPKHPLEDNLLSYIEKRSRTITLKCCCNDIHTFEEDATLFESGLSLFLLLQQHD
jgi:hypothetical protein